jgi:hypothetical protein
MVRQIDKTAVHISHSIYSQCQRALHYFKAMKQAKPRQLDNLILGLSSRRGVGGLYGWNWILSNPFFNLFAFFLKKYKKFIKINDLACSFLSLF